MIVVSRCTCGDDYKGIASLINTHHDKDFFIDIGNRKLQFLLFKPSNLKQPLRKLVINNELSIYLFDPREIAES